MKQSARVAGLLYLAMGVCTAFGMGYVDPSLYALGDPARSIERLNASAALARCGFAANLLGLVCLLWLANVLYELLSSASRAQARLMLIFVVTGVAIACLNLAAQLTALELARSPGASERKLAVTLLELHRQGGYIGGVFWGLWLLPFGRLVWVSGTMPKALGVLLIAGGAGYLVNCSVHFFAPGLQALSYPALALSALAELATIGWLLARGGRTPVAAA